MKQIMLEGGIKIVTFDPPPQNFDPLTANPAEPEKYGFPAMPDNPHHHERYQKVFRRLKHKLKFVEPIVRVSPGRTLAPGPPAAPDPSGTSTNWSGAVVYPPLGQSFKWIQGEWVVPNVNAPGSESTYNCCSFVGINGDSANSDALQAGVRGTVNQGGGSIERSFYFYWWWIPTLQPVGAGLVTSVPVSAGDLATVIICSAQGAGSTTATVYFANLTTGQSTHLALSAPTPLVGNSAEWIVSADIGARGLVPFEPLADYGEVVFNDCEAVTTPGKSTVDGGTGHSINMIAGGQVISQGILISPTTVECLYGSPPGTDKPVNCKDLLKNIYYHIGEGRNLPVQDLSLWERELGLCYTEGKISESEYTNAINLIHSHEK